MTARRTIRHALGATVARPPWLAICLVLIAASCSRAQQTGRQPVVLDRVVAVVNHQAILESDVDDEMRLSALDPGGVARGEQTPQRALQRLISRALIHQQIRAEDVQAAEPSAAEIQSRVLEIRRELPACVRMNCSTDAGWKAFLAGHDLTQQQVEEYLRRRITVLHFIELRFSQGIRIPHSEIEDYYRNTLLPQYPAGEAVPSLDKVAPRIEEILLQQQVNVLFGDWLDNLRNQGEIEVLDPTLEAAAHPQRRQPQTGGVAR